MPSVENLHATAPLALDETRDDDIKSDEDEDAILPIAPGAWNHSHDIHQRLASPHSHYEDSSYAAEVQIQDSDLPNTSVEDTGESKSRQEAQAVTWSSLPHKRQLAVLTLSRLSEPLVQTSLQSYMFYQLKSFDPSLSDAVIASQAGVLASSFAGAQFLTAMVWGRISDSERGGRKVVILVGLMGTLISVLGFGFATSFPQAVFFRVMGGMLNGNIGVMRTMVSEIVQEKKYQSRAFLLFPMCFNIGVIIGPILGGILADPAGTYPEIFGKYEWLKRHPYAPPNMLSAFILLCAFIGVFFCLEETLITLRHKEDFGTKCGRKIASLFRLCRGRRHISKYRYNELSSRDTSLELTRDFSEDLETAPKIEKMKPHLLYKYKLPFRRIFTRNVISTLIAHALLGIHMGTFNNLWFVFLSTPVADPAHPPPRQLPQKLPFVFTGGLGMPPAHVGFAMAILGAIGINMQLFVYPLVNARIGTLRSWRIFLCLFPLAYFCVPFLSLIPSASPPPHEKDGILVWVSICAVLLIQVVGRTFALPAMTILVNNCSPHPSVLGTVHGIGQSVGSAARTIGPTVGGFLYGLGLSKGIVGAVWWGLSGLAMLNCIASRWVGEGDGHEIWLEGDGEVGEEVVGEEEVRRGGLTRDV